MDKPYNRFAPKLSPVTLHGAKPTAHEKEPTFSIEFFVAFLSFTSLLLQTLYGTWAIVGFIAPWLLIISRKPWAVPDVMLKYWPLLLIPAYATLSAIWSDDHKWSAWAGLEFCGTAAIAILAVHYVKPRTLIAAMQSAFLIIGLICVINANKYFGDTPEDTPLTGIFASKNAFAAMMSLLMLISVGVFIDKKQPSLFRAASLVGIILTPALLYFGHSLGASAAAYFAIAVFIVERTLSRYPAQVRVTVCVSLFVLAFFAMLFSYIADFNPLMSLGMVGKDVTLTGRTHLWARAIDFISERPFLGVGYGAFWKVGNPRAEELWFYCKVPSGSGLGFHNEYIQAAVEFGLVGLTIIVGFLYVLTKRAVLAVLGTMTAEQNFAFILFVFFIIRTPVETSLFGQFNISMILLYMVWVYFQPKPIIKQVNIPHKKLASFQAKKIGISRA